MKGHKVIFTICLSLSVGLIIGGFFVPPMGVIDGSVLTAVGELFGFAALSALPYVINDHRATIQHGNTTLTIEEKETEETQRSYGD